MLLIVRFGFSFNRGAATNNVRHNPSSFAVGISPEAYKNVVQGNVYYNIQTNQKGVGGYIEKEGVSSFSLI